MVIPIGATWRLTTPLGAEIALGLQAGVGLLAPVYVVVDPGVWKRRMAAVTHHSGEDSRGARKRANDLKTIEVAQRVARDGGLDLDLLPVERGGGTKRSPSPDKAASFLLCVYGLRWILGLDARGGEP